MKGLFEVGGRVDFFRGGNVLHYHDQEKNGMIFLLRKKGNPGRERRSPPLSGRKGVERGA